VLPDWEIAALLDAADRYRAIVAILIGGGLRAAELVGIDVDDLSEDQDASSSRSSAARAARNASFRSAATSHVRRYLASSGRRLGGGGPLLLSDDRAHRLSDRRLSTREAARR